MKLVALPAVADPHGALDVRTGVVDAVPRLARLPRAAREVPACVGDAEAVPAGVPRRAAHPMAGVHLAGAAGAAARSLRTRDQGADRHAVAGAAEGAGLALDARAGIGNAEATLADESAGTASRVAGSSDAHSVSAGGADPTGDRSAGIDAGSRQAERRDRADARTAGLGDARAGFADVARATLNGHAAALLDAEPVHACLARDTRRRPLVDDAVAVVVPAVAELGGRQDLALARSEDAVYASARTCPAEAPRHASLEGIRGALVAEKRRDGAAGGVFVDGTVTVLVEPVAADLRDRQHLPHAAAPAARAAGPNARATSADVRSASRSGIAGLGNPIRAGAAVVEDAVAVLVDAVPEAAATVLGGGENLPRAGPPTASGAALDACLASALREPRERIDGVRRSVVALSGERLVDLAVAVVVEPIAALDGREHLPHARTEGSLGAGTQAAAAEADA